MSKSERLRRSCAGQKRSLSKDFIWPENFGRHQFSKPEEESRMISINLDQGHNETTSKLNLSEQKKSSKNSDEDLAIETNHSDKIYGTKTTGKSGSSSLSVARRRIALEAENKRHDLEMKLIALEKQEILKAIEIVNMEEDLRKDEISTSSHKSEISEMLYIPRNKLKKEETSEWVDNLPDVYTEINENHKIMETTQTGNEIRLLCETSQEVIRSTKPTRNSELNSRNTCIDLPYFNGNHKDWPLFIQQFEHISSSYDYSDIEITLKLQKCLEDKQGQQ
ncbi:uncharacterized protein LOC123313569 [Coccinella septempunctata]|uniref:uncharacterized protein LOC123313569 n=1 Tax=Coccinella septempunctata TaxID=41139 RepID=UPI001D0605B3|nr:uncharacterized protein LOC123313569 [Coccinella septempunctata]